MESPVTCVEGPSKIRLKYGNHINCKIDTVTDIDKFEFIGSTGQSIRIIVRSAWRLDAHLEVWDPDGAKIVDKFCVDNCTIVENLSLAKTGKYLMAISDKNFDEAGAYSLGLERILPIVSGLECIPYDTLGVACSINHVTDMDFFTFKGKSGTGIKIIVRSAWRLDARLEVWDPDGTKIVDKFCVDNCTIDENLSLTKTGKYLMAISDKNFDEAGNYSFNLSCITGNCPICPTPCDGNVVNDQMWTQTFGGGFNGEFSPGDGIVIKNMISIDDEDSGNIYDLKTIYKLVDSSNKTFNLGKKLRKRGEGHYYFTFNSATIPNSVALGKAKVKITTQLKLKCEKKVKVIDRHSKTVPVYIE